MLCISISDSPALTSALAGITKHGISSKHFTFWIKVLFNFTDVNLSIKFTMVTTLAMCRYECTMRCVRRPFSHSASHQGTGMPPKFCPTTSEHAGTSLSHPDHKVIHAPRDTFQHQAWMKSIPEKNLLWNRKSETAAALCLSWVISSLYSLIIDTALIRMTDPNVALCLCVSVGFF